MIALRLFLERVERMEENGRFNELYLIFNNAEELYQEINNTIGIRDKLEIAMHYELKETMKVNKMKFGTAKDKPFLVFFRDFDIYHAAPGDSPEAAKLKEEGYESFEDIEDFYSYVRDKIDKMTAAEEMETYLNKSFNEDDEDMDDS